MEAQILQFIRDFSKEIKENNAAIFAGAGLSMPAGFVNWRELLREIAADLKLEVDKESDLIAIAQYHFNEAGNNRHKLNKKLIDEFTVATRESPNHRILASLPIQTYWTTNYDRLIERAFEALGKTPDVKIAPANLANNLSKRDAIVYKMHGDVQLPDEAILTKDDYETYNTKRELFSIALRGDLVSKTFLFLGLSFDDPNLEYILSRIRVLLGQNQRMHYCFFKKLVERDYPNRDDFKYAVIRQELKARDLRRYGISALWIEEYNDITQILSAIEKKVKLNNIFISGAAATYAPINSKSAESLVHNLGYVLASKDFKIISGFGTGIGSLVINGALDYKLKTNYRHLDDVLILKPFPQVESEKISLKEMRTFYRKEMLQNAGAAIYLFGNKNDNGTSVPSTGMFEEFEIAKSVGVIPIPIGATGYIAEELWEKVMSSPGSYYPIDKELFSAVKNLGDKRLSNDELIANTVKVIEILQKQ